MFLLHQKLKHIKLMLKYWNKNEFGNIFEAKKVVEWKLRGINQILITDGFNEERTEQDDYHQHEWEGLCIPVNEEEVNEVIKQMQNGKAPGLDGFNVDFFKACWEIVKHDILDVVEDSRKNKTILKALNTSFISLIPKQDTAMTPDRFRPIALYNVVYKIISKIIANMLKPLLPTLVSEEKIRYVEGRQILNNIIQAHKVVHSLKSNR
eukprot:PITA_30153